MLEFLLCLYLMNIEIHLQIEVEIVPLVSKIYIYLFTIGF